MRFDLVQPCPECPFRQDIRAYLTKARVDELQTALVEQQRTFSCHKTVDYDRIEETEDESGIVSEARTAQEDEQHCAGALILLEKLGTPNQMMRWMERLHDPKGDLYYDRSRLKMDAPVFPSFAAMRQEQTR